jgi:hypothetical protein
MPQSLRTQMTEDVTLLPVLCRGEGSIECWVKRPLVPNLFSGSNGRNRDCLSAVTEQQETGRNAQHDELEGDHSH